MAFFAAGVWKGAQYVKREVKKSNQRNALIVADDTVARDAKTLAVQKDWWDADGAAAPPAPSGDALVPLGDSQRISLTSLEDEEVEEPLPRPPTPPPHEPPANAAVQGPPASVAVQEPPSNVAARKHPASGAVRGSYMEQLQARGAMPSASARPEASALVRIGASYAAHLQAHSDAAPTPVPKHPPAHAPTPTAALAPTRPEKTALKKTAARPRAVPGSFSAALESCDVPLPAPAGSRRQPRKDTQPTDAPHRPAVPSGSFTEALQRQHKATGAPGAACNKGSFLEATRRRQGGGASWNDFIDKAAAQGGEQS